MKRLATQKLNRFRTSTGAVVTRLKLYDAKILRAIGKKKKKVLFKTASWTLTAMQQSMRYRKKPSEPGEPPHAHKKWPHGPALRKASRFDVDLAEGSAVIGPMKFTNVSQPSGMPVPELLNKGGPVLAEDETGGQVIATIEPRPFTPTAFAAGLKEFRKRLEQEPL